MDTASQWNIWNIQLGIFQHDYKLEKIYESILETICLPPTKTWERYHEWPRIITDSQLKSTFLLPVKDVLKYVNT